MEFQVLTKTIPETPVMMISRTLPYARVQEISQDFDALFGYILQKGGEITGSFLRYVGECTMESMNMEICIAVKTLLPPSGDIQALTLPALKATMAQGMYKGPYTGLNAFYEKMDAWFKAQGLPYGEAPMWEIYLNNPAETPEEELLTEILFPIGT